MVSLDAVKTYYMFSSIINLLTIFWLVYYLKVDEVDKPM